jgi:hypothetical protein
MKNVIEKKRCPHCGQIISLREIALYRGLVLALWRVYQYILQCNRGWSFTRKEIKHLFASENDTARFGDWVLFGGLVFKEKKAHYGINLNRCRDFFEGNLSIPIRVIKNPVSNMITPLDYKTINNIPSIMTFLNEDGYYVPRYY